MPLRDLSRECRNTGKLQLPGRGRPGPRPDDPLAVQQQGDLSPRADLQRLGRHRPAAVRAVLAARARGRRPGQPLQIRVGYDADARTITVSDNGIGMSREEVIDNIGTIAKSGHPRVPARADRRPAQGRDPHRPVRRRLLLGVHRGRPGDADYPAGRAARRRGRPLGVRRPGRVHAGAGGAAGPGHRRSCCTCATGEDDLLNGYRLRSIIQRYSDHISLPILMPAEAAGDERPASRRRTVVNQASALWARPKSELSDAGLPRRSTGTSPATSPSRWPTCTARSRGPTSTRCCCSSRPRRPFDLWLPEARPRRQAARPAGVHHGRHRPAHAEVPAVRPRRDRLRATCR